MQKALSKQQYFDQIRNSQPDCFPDTVIKVVWWSEFWSKYPHIKVNFNFNRLIFDQVTLNREGVEL